MIWWPLTVAGRALGLCRVTGGDNAAGVSQAYAAHPHPLRHRHFVRSLQLRHVAASSDRSEARLHLMADSNSPGVTQSPKRASTPLRRLPADRPPMDPVAVIRSKRYIAALVLAAIVGIPVSAVAYGFLALVSAMQRFLFTELPNQMLGTPAPAWWPLPWLVLCGLLVGLTIRYLPGNGGHSPAFGFQTGGGPATAPELPGIILAALATLSLGAVLGPKHR